MSDIDYSKYSFRNYKSGKGSVRHQKGKIRYSFSNYDTYIKDVKNYEKAYEQLACDIDSNNIIEPNKLEDYDELDNDDGLNNAIEEDNIVDIYNIKDIRTKKKTAPEKEIVKPNEHFKKKRDIIAILMIVLCFALTITSVDILVNGGIFSNLSNVFAKQSDTKVYYAIEVGSYPDNNSAKEIAELFKSRNAAGYVINDKSYRVIAAVYDDRKNAEIIVDKLINDGIQACIYEMKTKSVDYSKYNELGSHIENALNGCQIIYDRLYQISNSLDKEEITKSEARVDILKLKIEIEAVCETFKCNTEEYDDEVVLKVKTELISYISILDNLINNNTTSSSLISDVRYSYTMILNMYCALTRSL